MIDLSDYLASWREYYGSGSGMAIWLPLILLAGLVQLLGLTSSFA